MIKLRQRGNFEKLTNFFTRIEHFFNMSVLDEYGRRGVEALSYATPKKSGRTAASWRYEVVISDDGASIQFLNDNVIKGVPIAIILQYGHGTRNGGYVEGIDYINPSIQPIFEQMAEQVWKEAIE